MEAILIQINTETFKLALCSTQVTTWSYPCFGKMSALYKESKSSVSHSHLSIDRLSQSSVLQSDSHNTIAKVHIGVAVLTMGDLEAHIAEKRVFI